MTHPNSSGPAPSDQLHITINQMLARGYSDFGFMRVDLGLFRVLPVLDAVFFSALVNAYRVAKVKDADQFFLCTGRFLEAMGWPEDVQKSRFESLRGVEAMPGRPFIVTERRGIPSRRWVKLDLYAAMYAVMTAENEKPLENPLVGLANECSPPGISHSSATSTTGGRPRLPLAVGQTDEQVEGEEPIGSSPEVLRTPKREPPRAAAFSPGIKSPSSKPSNGADGTRRKEGATPPRSPDDSKRGISTPATVAPKPRSSAPEGGSTTPPPDRVLRDPGANGDFWETDSAGDGFFAPAADDRRPTPADEARARKIRAHTAARKWWLSGNKQWWAPALATLRRKLAAAGTPEEEIDRVWEIYEKAGIDRPKIQHGKDLLDHWDWVRSALKLDAPPPAEISDEAVACVEAAPRGGWPIDDRKLDLVAELSLRNFRKFADAFYETKPADDGDRGLRRRLLTPMESDRWFVTHWLKTCHDNLKGWDSFRGDHTYLVWRWDHPWSLRYFRDCAASYAGFGSRFDQYVEKYMGLSAGNAAG